MKNTKIFFGLLVLAAAVLAFGCNQANNTSPSSSGGASGGFALNAQQKPVYDAFISALALSATNSDVPAYVVKNILDSSQGSFTGMGFKVTDKTPDEKIKTGTKAAVLEKRFIPSAK